MEQELKQALSDLQAKVSADSERAIEEKFSALTQEHLAASSTQAERLDQKWQELKEAADSKVSELNTVTAKLKEARSTLTATPAGHRFTGEVKRFIQANHKSISGFAGKVRYSTIQGKAAGDMTTSNISGPPVRSYNTQVVGTLPRLVHFIDVIGQDIQISGGVFTFPLVSSVTGKAGKQIGEFDAKNKLSYGITHVDVATDFIAGITRYSKKMRNNVPYLESWLPGELRIAYLNAEDELFNLQLSQQAEASTQGIENNNKVELLMREIAVLEQKNVAPNRIVVSPGDFYDIMSTEKSPGAGYGLPGLVTLEGGVLRINGIAVIKANWLASNSYYVGDFTQVNRVVTEGLALEFSEHDQDNFSKNAITARIEAQVGLAIRRPYAITYGNFWPAPEKAGKRKPLTTPSK